MPAHRNHRLHFFDARSLLLFTGLTLGGTSALMAQNPAPAAGALTAPSPSAAKQLFDSLDVDQDGSISAKEAEIIPALATRFNSLDTDQSGSLSLLEFEQGLKPQA